MCGFSFICFLFGIIVVFGCLFLLCSWARPLGLARLVLHKYTFSFFWCVFCCMVVVVSHVFVCKVSFVILEWAVTLCVCVL